MNFNTVSAVTRWRDFLLDGTIYDLSHLNAQHIEYLDPKDVNKPIVYRFIVTYGLHCFTKELEGQSAEQIQRLMYHGPRESRPFNFERYELSKYLPAIVESLGSQETLVCHAGYGSYAAVKISDASGNEINYFVPFVAFREKKRLRLHVQSAYPRPEGIGRVRKVNFFAIAHNLLHHRKLPSP